MKKGSRKSAMAVPTVRTTSDTFDLRLSHAHRLFSHRCVTREHRATARTTERLAYVYAVRLIIHDGKDALLARSFYLDNKTFQTIIVKPLLYPVCFDENISRVLLSQLRGVAYEGPRSCTLFHSDLKRDTRCAIIAVDTYKDYKKVVYTLKDLNKHAAGADAEPLLFQPLTHFNDGNFAAVTTQLLSNHFYFLPSALSISTCGDTTVVLRPATLRYDQEVDVHHITNYMRLIHRHCFREGALDIETVVNRKNINRRLLCAEYEQYLARHQRAVEEYKLQHPESARVNAKLDNELSLSLKEVLSCSLVYGRRMRDKRDGTSDTTKNQCDGGGGKMKVIFYNKDDRDIENPLSIDNGVLEETRESLDYITMIACKNEYDMLRQIFERIATHVDVLYVYNLDFDIYVLHCRVIFYTQFCTWTSREEREALLSAYNRAFSKSSYFRHRLCMKFDSMVSTFKNQWRDYSKAYQKIHNSTVNGFGVYVIDLHKVTHVENSSKISRQNRRLDTVAADIVSRHRPKKCAEKIHKLQNISYDVLDEYYSRGGQHLFRYLMYNLVDSQLLMRIARCVNPVRDLIFRCRATFSCDIICHSRGNMYFIGFVKSSTAVENSLLMSRYTNNIVLSQGKNADALLPAYMKMKKCIFEGGFVSEPFTAVVFAGPRHSCEINLDFASLYPSNMIDCCISPESLVSKEESSAPYLRGFVVMDMHYLGHDVYSIVMDLRADAQYRTSTNGSLFHYLSLRKEYKRRLKTCTDDMQRQYFDCQQREMKLCANSHYGVAKSYCQILITAVGRHKIKVVNRALETYHYVEDRRVRPRERVDVPLAFSNYGDTDSTMFCLPRTLEDTDVEITPQGESDDSRALDETHERYCRVTRDKIMAESRVTNKYLEHIKLVLFDDYISRLLYFPLDGSEPQRLCDSGACDARGFRIYTAREGDKDHDITKIVLSYQTTELEYENCSSIVLHLQKKSYVALVHEPNAAGHFNATGVKVRGSQGKKSNAMGCITAFENMIEKLLLKGGFAYFNSRDAQGPLDPLQWHVATWDEIRACKERRDKILYFDGAQPMFGEHGECVNFDDLQLGLHSVRNVRETSCVFGSDKRTTLRVSLRGADGTRKILFRHLTGNVCLDHLTCYWDNVFRTKCIMHLTEIFYLATNSGLHDWSNLVSYWNVHDPAVQTFLQRRRSLHLNEEKTGKVPYVIIENKGASARNAYKRTKVVSVQRQNEAAAENTRRITSYFTPATTTKTKRVDSDEEEPDAQPETERRDTSDVRILASCNRYDPLDAAFHFYPLDRKIDSLHKLVLGNRKLRACSDQKVDLDSVPRRVNATDTLLLTPKDVFRRTAYAHTMARGYMYNCVVYKHILNTLLVNQQAKYVTHLIIDAFMPKTLHVPLNFEMRQLVLRVHRSLASFARRCFDVCDAANAVYTALSTGNPNEAGSSRSIQLNLCDAMTTGSAERRLIPTIKHDVYEPYFGASDGVALLRATQNLARDIDVAFEKNTRWFLYTDDVRKDAYHLLYKTPQWQQFSRKYVFRLTDDTGNREIMKIAHQIYYMRLYASVLKSTDVQLFEELFSRASPSSSISDTVSSVSSCSVSISSPNTARDSLSPNSHPRISCVKVPNKTLTKDNYDQWAIHTARYVLSRLPAYHCYCCKNFWKSRVGVSKNKTQLLRILIELFEILYKPKGDVDFHRLENFCIDDVVLQT
nr:polymerase [Tiger shark herpes-like virus]